MRVLGIDPGSITTGYGIVEMNGGKLSHIDNGSVTCKKETLLENRLKLIFDSLHDIIASYAPAIMAVERIFVSKGAASALKLGHARGVAILSAVNKNIDVVQYTPMEVKKAVTGYGKADKEQVKYMVAKLLNIPCSLKTDASDALAVAICHLHTVSAASVKRGLDGVCL